MIRNIPLRSDEILKQIEWPTLEEIHEPRVQQGDCVLVCAGFEDRAVEFLRRTCELPISGFTLGLIRYGPELSQNRVEELRKHSLRADLNVTEFYYDRENPSGIGEELLDFSRRFPRVLIDIAGMSRLLIVQAIVALIRGRVPSISVLYSEAMEYPPTKDEFESDLQDGDVGQPVSYLSSGIFEIAAAPELSSVSMSGEAIRLIAFPSFDPAQLENSIQELQPTYTDVIHGAPPDVENEWRMEAIRLLNELTLDELHRKSDFTASTLDYREAMNIILAIYGRRSMFDRLVIAPTGSKMQTVAVGIIRAVLHDVQVVYPTPHVFTQPDRYTLGVRRIYQLDLPTDAIWGAIKSVDTSNDEIH